MQPSDMSAKSLTAMVLGRLRADILKGRMAPHTKLRLDDLRKRYDVGLSPLREALSRLAAEGLVVAEDQRGFTVAPTSLEDLDDLTWLRSSIEPLALTRAIELGGDAWEADLVRAYHHLTLAPLPSDGASNQEMSEWEHRHKAFHDALVAACGSPRLVQLHDRLFDQFSRYLRLAVVHTGVTRDPDSEHKALVEAALARDADRAAQLMRNHIRVTAEIVRAVQVRQVDAVLAPKRQLLPFG